MVSAVIPEVDPAVAELIDRIENTERKAEAWELLQLMTEVTGEPPSLWGDKTIGFGSYHYRYGSGQEGDFFKIGFSPRSKHLTLYVMSGLRGFEDILERLGPHRASKSTVHLTRLDEADREVLSELISECVKHVDFVEETMGAVPRMSEIPPRS